MVSVVLVAAVNLVESVWYFGSEFSGKVFPVGGHSWFFLAKIIGVFIECVGGFVESTL